MTLPDLEDWAQRNAEMLDDEAEALKRAAQG